MRSEKIVRSEKKLMPEHDFRKSIEKVLNSVRAQRLFAVEEFVRPTFEAFPKNSKGRVPMQAIHSIVRSYMAEEHGWLIKAFEFTSRNSTELQEALILRARAPAIAAALEEQAHRADSPGLSLSDVVSIVAAVEHVILDEMMPVLRGAYTLNAREETDQLDRDALVDVLTSFLLVFRQGSKRNLKDPRRHMVYKKHARKSVDFWQGLVKFAKDATEGIEHTGLFSFEEASQIARDMMLGYGKWQHGECHMMKTRLVELDTSGTGRVPFEIFSAQPAHAHYQFAETGAYLRQIGALDESEGAPQVLVANYLAAPTNCIASSEYYSVCCLSECEGLVNALEGKVKASEVPPRQLLEAVGGIASSTVGTRKELPPGLVQLAHAIASQHLGFVPLHSADFKRWMHYAFPNECPFPTEVEAMAEDAEGLTAERWLGKDRVSAWQISAEAELINI